MIELIKNPVPFTSHFGNVAMIEENRAEEIAKDYLGTVVRSNLGREKDILTGNTYYKGEGWLFRHEIAKDLMGGNPGIIAVEEQNGEIVTFNSEHSLAKRMKDFAEKNAYIRKHGFF